MTFANFIIALNLFFRALSSLMYHLRWVLSCLVLVTRYDESIPEALWSVPRKEEVKNAIDFILYTYIIIKGSSLKRWWDFLLVDLFDIVDTHLNCWLVTGLLQNFHLIGKCVFVLSLFVPYIFIACDERLHEINLVETFRERSLGQWAHSKMRLNPTISMNLFSPILSAFSFQIGDSF